ncbi:MAG: hypothetical protein MJ136_01410 [Clostridia bacterium]|nr:hypothetical protein [Clostridia bacterium]
MSSMQVNVKRNAAWAVVVNVLQIIAVLSVTALIFWERGGLAAWGLLVASLIVSFGAVIDIR